MMQSEASIPITTLKTSKRLPIAGLPFFLITIRIIHGAG
jgi:hypothetical protein